MTDYRLTEVHLMVTVNTSMYKARSFSTNLHQITVFLHINTLTFISYRQLVKGHLNGTGV